MPRFHLTRLNDKSASFSLLTGRAIIGRNKNCDIVLLEKSVSREHAIITTTDEGTIRITDLRSRNGTYIDGRQISEEYLLPGSTVRFGCLEFVLSVVDDDDDDDDDESVFPTTLSPTLISDWASIECWRTVTQQLSLNHVLCKCVDSSDVEVLLSNATFLNESGLTTEFRKIVVIDSRHGEATPGNFNIDHFFLYLTTLISREFATAVDLEWQHPETMTQILIDESRSLFVFLYCDILPREVFPALRGFTQDKHQCLFVCNSSNFGLSLDPSEFFCTPPLCLSSTLSTTLAELITGATIKRIAERRNLSEKTIKRHARSIYNFFGVLTRADLIKLYVRQTNPR